MGSGRRGKLITAETTGAPTPIVSDTPPEAWVRPEPIPVEQAIHVGGALLADLGANFYDEAYWRDSFPGATETAQ